MASLVKFSWSRDYGGVLSAWLAPVSCIKEFGALRHSLIGLALGHLEMKRIRYAERIGSDVWRSIIGGNEGKVVLPDTNSTVLRVHELTLIQY